MFANAFNAVQGKKTYILAIVGALVAVIGHFWGPVGAYIPAVTSQDMWKAIWAVSSLASLRHGISTSGGTNEPTKS